MFWSPTKAPGVLAPEHGYVLLVLVTTWFVHNGWMASKVMAARKKHNIKYPTLYAVGDSDSDKKFNCVQRGHQNSLEGLPSFLALLLSAARFYPAASAVAGAIYNIGAIRYMNGYSTGDPTKRMRGSIKYIGLLFLLGANVRAAVRLLLDV
mmetsp:Transcript_8188/g.22214  ORF Transcript_8188/g.22214 Transcript_8188/m.22214 type:complete len:151 (+) Transcript_8188:95-547(+)